MDSMSERTEVSTPKRRKLKRSEKNDAVKRRIFSAAAKVVGRFGYADASVARITELAGVAQGTFYNHFENRQQLLDQLLPGVGRDMLEFIRDKIDRESSEAEKEVARFNAFFEFLRKVPEFLRILNEAEFFAPSGYHQHLDNITKSYVATLKKARDKKQIAIYSDEELEVIVNVLMGARGYLSRRYAYGEDGEVIQIPNYVESAYKKLILHGLIDYRRSIHKNKN
jgi:AcrR family transcriptional regulator